MPNCSSPRVATLAFVAVVLSAASVTTAAAQTIRPLGAEYRSDGRGRIELVNPTDRPLNVVMEAKGFRVDESGEVRDEPLPAAVRLRLSAMSLRIPPHQTRYVFYDASASQRPAWFVLYANFTGYSRAQFNGVNVQLELPHFVYLLPNERWKTGDIAVSGVEFHRDTGKLAFTVENTGAQFGRIDALDVKRSGKKVIGPAFPLFPQGRRRVELDWSGDDEPDVVSIRSRDFSLERKLEIRP